MGEKFITVQDESLASQAPSKAYYKNLKMIEFLSESYDSILLGWLVILNPNAHPVDNNKKTRNPFNYMCSPFIFLICAGSAQ